MSRIHVRRRGPTLETATIGAHHHAAYVSMVRRLTRAIAPPSSSLLTVCPFSAFRARSDLALRAHGLERGTNQRWRIH